MNYFYLNLGRSFAAECRRNYSKCVKLVEIKKMVIANRGEIACRIMRTAKKMGIQTVAVYSEVDKNSMHVAMADEAYWIGPPEASESYLRRDKMLSVAKLTKSDAIHPGYGFLSESAEFAEDCIKNNVIFIGPPASAIRDMGIKSTSKALMESASVPVIKGYHKEDQSNSTLIKAAQDIGFPIMIKAVRGGGGKGMRIAMNPDEFTDQVESARREATKSFGDDALLLEQLISNPRHIEVQIFGDQFDNYVYLFERDCSVQRRHQKIIEEAPAPGVSNELRKQLGDAAVRAARAVGYVGAGTVEFIYDIDSKNFYFMEMNTRLQVEHPITEMITGTDLVEWQILVAGGHKLPILQDDLKFHGHSVEARIYAEDPFNSFMPAAGKLIHLQVPQLSKNVRVDTGVRKGDVVSVYYDPMIAKLVVWDEDRSKAFKRLHDELLDFHVVGVSTNIEFLLTLIKHPDMQAANVHTGFIAQHGSSLFDQTSSTPVESLVQATLAVVLTERKDLIGSASYSNNPYNPFVHMTGFRVNHKLTRNIYLTNCKNNENVSIEILYEKGNAFTVKIGNEIFNVVSDLIEDDGGLTVESDFGTFKSATKIFKNGDQLHLFSKDSLCKFTVNDLKSFEMTDFEASVTDEAVSPMPGTVDKVLVNPGDKVKCGDPLLIIMAMKMEHVIKSPKDGVIESVLYKEGDTIEKDVPLVTWKQ